MLFNLSTLEIVPDAPDVLLAWCQPLSQWLALVTVRSVPPREDVLEVTFAELQRVADDLRAGASARDAWARVGVALWDS